MGASAVSCAGAPQVPARASAAAAIFMVGFVMVCAPWMSSGVARASILVESRRIQGPGMSAAAIPMAASRRSFRVMTSRGRRWAKMMMVSSALAMGSPAATASVFQMPRMPRAVSSSPAGAWIWLRKMKASVGGLVGWLMSVGMSQGADRARAASGVLQLRSCPWQIQAVSAASMQPVGVMDASHR